MAYFGRQLTTSGNYLKLDDIQSQFNSSTTTFNLTSGGSAFYPGSAFSLLVSINGTVQEPNTDYTINQNTIIFVTAPQSAHNFFCIVLGVSLGIGVPGEGTVSGSKLTEPFDYNDGLLYLDSVNNRIGINSTVPTKALDVVGDVRVTGVVTATTFVGALTGTATSTTNIPNLTGDITSVNKATTLATVNSNVGTFGSGGAIPTITVNAKGLITAVTTTAVTSGTTITDDTSTNATRYLPFTSATSGSISAANVSSTKLTFNPSTGTLSATAFTSLSDVNKKKNIRRITNALDITKKLEGVRFNWKENQKPSIGVIAQELEKVLPELVTQGEVKSVNYNGIIGVLIEAIKEQQVRIEELERKSNA